MKRLIILLWIVVTGGGVVLTSCSPALSKSRKLEITREIDSLITNVNFQFIPTDVYSRTMGDRVIRGYEYAKFMNGRIYVDMTGLKFEGFYEGSSPYDRMDKRGDRWYVTSVMDMHTGKITFDFVITRSTGNAVLKVTTNRGAEQLTYQGAIQKN